MPSSSPGTADGEASPAQKHGAGDSTEAEHRTGLMRACRGSPLHRTTRIDTERRDRRRTSTRHGAKDISADERSDEAMDVPQAEAGRTAEPGTALTLGGAMTAQWQPYQRRGNSESMDLDAICMSSR